MRVIVLGAGLLGVTSAYYLQQLGHDVTVVDRHATPCAKARGRVAVAATDGAPSLASRPAPGRLAGAMATLWRAMRQKTRAIAIAFGPPPPDRVDNMVRLGAYSQKTVRELRDDAGVPHAPGSAGLLRFYMDQRAFAGVTARAPRLAAMGCEALLVSADEAVRVEPALSAMHAQLAGASYLADDPARDPAPTATGLVFLCRAAGVRFLTNHTVVALQKGNDRIDQVDLIDAKGEPLSLRADAYVMALGAGSVAHADALDIDMPLHLMREYAVTMPIKESSRAPRVALQDQSGKLRIARVQTDQGDCLRASATVRACSDEEREPDSDRFNAILRRVALLLPGVADASRAQFHTRLHTASADGLPLVGRTRLRNLFLNTAPGAHSWVNACGAGKSIARIVSGLRPELAFAFTGM